MNYYNIIKMYFKSYSLETIMYLNSFECFCKGTINAANFFFDRKHVALHINSTGCIKHNDPITNYYNNFVVIDDRKKRFTHSTEGSWKLCLRISQLFCVAPFSHTQNIHIYCMAVIVNGLCSACLLVTAVYVSLCVMLAYVNLC